MRVEISISITVVSGLVGGIYHGMMVYGSVRLVYIMDVSTVAY